MTDTLNAMGGTEIINSVLHSRINPELLKEFQIIPSRVTELDETKIRILHLHDLPGDPASEHLKNGGWRKFHKLVFVSNHQMQSYIQYYQIPWSHCIVMYNAIDPIEEHEKPNTDTINLIYTPTPHRGLELLYPVFEKLAEKHDNLHLDVFSSFKLYGWEERDAPYQPLYEKLEQHPMITYHGSKDNATIREALKQSHIFAYPSIWQETSCICLIEAMSAGLICIHSNLGALYETGSGLTNMYQYNENHQVHANIFYNVLDTAIEHVKEIGYKPEYAVLQKLRVNTQYNWESRIQQWEAFLNYMLTEVKDRKIPGQMFSYRT